MPNTHLVEFGSSIVTIVAAVVEQRDCHFTPTEVSKYNNIPSIKEKKMAFIENVIAPQLNYIKTISN